MQKGLRVFMNSKTWPKPHLSVDRRESVGVGVIRQHAISHIDYNRATNPGSPTVEHIPFHLNCGFDSH